MLDVHPPQEAVHTWKDFFIHIATIVVGLLIALALEQTVEVVHRHSERVRLQEDLRYEIDVNRERATLNLALLNRDMAWLLELRQRVDAVRGGAPASSFEYPPPPPGYPGDPDHSDRRIPAQAVWLTARDKGTTDLLPVHEAQYYTVLYQVADIYTESFANLTANWQKLTAFELQFRPHLKDPPDIRRMSPAQIDRYSEILSELFVNARDTKRHLQVQMAFNEMRAGPKSPVIPNMERYFQEHPDPLPASYLAPLPPEPR